MTGAPHYQQSDSLSTATDVPLSGTGTSTPEGSAGNADYSAWQWEVVLSTVLSIPVPDRGEVTGQPWLTMGHDGQGSPGSHLIWSAGWNTGQNSGATSIQVYLSPALYTNGGAWDRFLNAPAQALSGVPSHQYAGLPLVPPSFEAAGLVVASVTDFMDEAARKFGGMHRDATSGPIVGFQGNLADAVAELVGNLQSVMIRLHGQMTEPVRYSDSIEAAGTSAATFLADLLAAHSSWTQLVEHTPLGAVVTTLEHIATRDSSGSYVIPDPQNTPYGDLTDESSWALVEQDSKNLWAGTLTGGSAGFAGLDLLGRTALSKMINQFAAATSALVPVVGPAPPQIRPNPMNATTNTGGSGDGHGNLHGPGGGNAADPGSGPPPNLLVTSNEGGPGGLSVPADPATGLASPIGAISLAGGRGGDGPAGFTGTIGLPAAGERSVGGRRTGTSNRVGLGKKAVDKALTAPAAGFSLGRDPGGAVLEQSAVPTIAARPSAVTSSMINIQSARVPVGTNTATPGPLAGDASLAAPAASAQATGEGTAVLAGDGGVLGRSMMSADAIGIEGVGVEGGPAMLPMGGVCGAGTGVPRVERERLAYLPQDPRYWGTEPDLVTTSSGTATGDDDSFTEQCFQTVPSRIAGIGARGESEQREEPITDRRMP